MKKLIIDSAHSEIGFKVKHLMISTVKGSFGTFSGSMEGEMDNMTISFNLNTSSINTNNVDRDNHLKSTDFFDSVNFPTITFFSTGADINSGVIKGELIIRGTTKEVTLTCNYNGMSVDPWGNTKHGFEITGNINRNDFGLTWNSPLETGGVLVSDIVGLNIDVQMTEVVKESATQSPE